MAKKAEEKVTIERPYTLRRLKDGDLIPLLGLLRKLGLKDYKETIVAAANGADVKDVGVNVVLNLGDVLISHLEDEAGEAIYEFWSKLSGLSVDEMKDMEFGTLPLMIYDTFSDVKDSSFFRVLAKSL